MKKLIIIITILGIIPWNNNYAQGCMEVSDEEGVTILGYIQSQAEYNFLGENLRGESLNTADMYFNRVRLGVAGNIAYDFSYYAMTELSPTLGGPNILDAFITYKRFGPYANISMGQFRSPFGLELGNTACHQLFTINRTEVVSNLAGPFRDFGFMISGGTDKWNPLGTKTQNLIGYKIAITNGTGLNTPDNNRQKDIVARFTFHPFDFITIGANYRTGKHPALNPDTEDDERSRYGFDVDLNYKNFRIQGEFIDGSDKGSYTIGGGCGDPIEVIQGSVNRQGFFAQAMYRTKWDIEPVFKFEKYDPSMADTDINDIQNIMTYGFNYYINDWTRMQVNYLYKAEESAVVEHPNDALLFQMQIVF